MTEITAAMVKELREQTGAGMMDVKNALTEAKGDKEEAVKILRKKGLAAASKKAGRVTSEGAVYALIDGQTGVLVEVNSETDFVAKNEQFRQFVADVAKLIASSSATTVDELKNVPWPNDPEGFNVEKKLASMVGTIKENIGIRRFVKYAAAANAALSSYIHAGGKIGVLVELAVASGTSGPSAAAVAKDVAMHIAAAEPRFLHRSDVTEKDLDTEREIARDLALKSGKPENIVEKMVTGRMEKFYGEACLLEQPFVKDDKLTITQHLEKQGKEAGCKYTVTRFTRYKLGEGIKKDEGPDFAAEVAAMTK
ncbi:MAG TPA: translation elongation factor Ts [Thermoanaerobaculia bacterium]|nr:translation elongation factor Ts [Thermoanaerobaculia bacterium]